MNSTAGNAASTNRSNVNSSGGMSFSPQRITTKLNPQIVTISTAAARCRGFIATKILVDEARLQRRPLVQFIDISFDAAGFAHEIAFDRVGKQGMTQQMARPGPHGLEAACMLVFALRAAFNDLQS